MVMGPPMRGKVGSLDPQAAITLATNKMILTDLHVFPTFTSTPPYGSLRLLPTRAIQDKMSHRYINRTVLEIYNPAWDTHPWLDFTPRV
jgi:hypothetical protein